MPPPTGRTPVTLTSADPTAERVAALRTLFPDCACEDRIDFDKLRAALGNAVEMGPERFTFSWAGRSDAVAVLQTPSRATLVPRLKESVNWDTTRNLFIEGDNLEVLKWLRRGYSGKIKLIYIDPPYNTGQDFVYPDNFIDPLGVYLTLTKQTDEAGKLLTSNPDRSGRFHSTWLSMMYPRLFLAWQLLREDGAIFVSIDDNEVHHLRLLMNELFGEENFLACFVRRRRLATGMRDDPVSPDHEYVLCYARSLDRVKLFGRTKNEADYPFTDRRGKYRSTDLSVGMTRKMRPNQYYAIRNPKTGTEYWPSETRVWRFEPKTMQGEIENENIIWPDDNPSQSLTRPRYKTRFDPDDAEDTSPVSTWIASSRDEALEPGQNGLRAGLNQEATKQLQELFDAQVLEYPKPVSLLKALIATGMGTSGIVLDFFAGSSTTGQAVLELNREDGGSRQFIMVQLQEPTQNKKFPTIAAIGKERIRRVIKQLRREPGSVTRTAPEDLGFKVFALAESHFEQWRGAPERDPAKYAEVMNLFRDPIKPGADPVAVTWELAIKEGYGLNSTITPAKVGANTVYTVTDAEKDPPQSLRICLDEQLAPDIARRLGLTGTDLFICRDSALDDTLAANLALQCRLKTI